MAKHKIQNTKDDPQKFCEWIHNESDEDKIKLMEVWKDANFFQLLSIASKKSEKEIESASCIAGALMALGPVESSVEQSGVSLGVAAHEICIGPLKEGEAYLRKKLSEDRKLVEEYQVVRRNGKFIKEGFFKQYHSNEKISREAKYKNDLLEGSDNYWRENGSKTAQTEFRRGKKYGAHKSWNERGVMIEEGTYVDDLNDGIWKYYREGKVEREVEYKKGKVINETKYNG